MQRFLALPDAPALGAQLRTELALDSFALVTIVFELEQKLGLDLSALNFALADVRSVGDLVQLMARVPRSKPGPGM